MGLPDTSKLRDLISDKVRENNRNVINGLVNAWNILAGETDDPEIRLMDGFESEMAECAFSMKKFARFVQNGDGFDGTDKWFWIDWGEESITSADDALDLLIDLWELTEAVASPDYYDCAGEVADALSETLGVDPKLYVLVDVY